VTAHKCFSTRKSDLRPRFSPGSCITCGRVTRHLLPTQGPPHINSSAQLSILFDLIPSWSLESGRRDVGDVTATLVRRKSSDDVAHIPVLLRTEPRSQICSATMSQYPCPASPLAGRGAVGSMYVTLFAHLRGNLDDQGKWEFSHMVRAVIIVWKHGDCAFVGWAGWTRGEKHEMGRDDVCRDGMGGV
jgi:hypothetical protein